MDACVIKNFNMNEPLDDESEMPYGQHKGELMIDVPAKYLLWLYDNDRCNVPVKAYIEKCIEILRKE